MGVGNDGEAEDRFLRTEEGVCVSRTGAAAAAARGGLRRRYSTSNGQKKRDSSSINSVAGVKLFVVFEYYGGEGWKRDS